MRWLMTRNSSDCSSGICRAMLVTVSKVSMVWSSGDLFGATMNRLLQAGYDIATLPVLRDIDLPADLSLAKDRGLL